MVKIYATPMCGKCKQLKSFCDANGVVSTLVDITEDTDARAKLLAENKLSVPVIEKNGMLFDGPMQSLQIVALQ